MTHRDRSRPCAEKLLFVCRRGFFYEGKTRFGSRSRRAGDRGSLWLSVTAINNFINYSRSCNLQRISSKTHLLVVISRRYQSEQTSSDFLLQGPPSPLESRPLRGKEIRRSRLKFCGSRLEEGLTGRGTENAVMAWAASDSRGVGKGAHMCVPHTFRSRACCRLWKRGDR